jgi:Holliday junction resolvase RusA-like endonuclease
LAGDVTVTTFVIPGKPFGKQRPRFSRKSGRAFTPAETVSYERTVGSIAMQHFPAPISGPVRLEVHATFKPADSWSAKKRNASLGRPHVQKPDLDNLVKGVSDALNRIAFADDSQIAEVTCSKEWGECDQIAVSVVPL